MTELIAQSIIVKHRWRGVPCNGLHKTSGLARYSFSLRNDSSHSFVHTNRLFLFKHWK